MKSGAAELWPRVERLTADVKHHRGDEECWHSDLDGILIDALRLIVDVVDDPQATAKAALEANELEFSRWYA